MKKAQIIIQARRASTRLPDKVLKDILGKPVLELVIERVRKAGMAEDILVATTKRIEDKEIVVLANRLGVEAFTGSEDDVLDRYYEAAKKYSMKHIIRITADCPLIDPEVIDKVAEHYFGTEADYCSNMLERSFPDGEDVEVFSFSVLEDAWKNSNLASEREHVTPYIVKNPEKFELENFKIDKDFSGKRWCMDQDRDFQFIKRVYEALYPKDPGFSMYDVLDFLAKHPEVEAINKDIDPNEGYQKSLREDRVVGAGGRDE